MKRLLTLIVLLAAGSITSCKSTGVIADSATHGIDNNGNVWMTPPPAGEGIQIEVMPYDVPDSTEVQGDFYLHIPSDLPIDVGRIEIAMNEGTHHMNLYKTRVAWPDSGELRQVGFTHIDGKKDTAKVYYQKQFNASIVANNQNDLTVEAQVPYLNWEFPKLTDGPNAGTQTCVHFGANDTIIIENHYVNVPNLNGGGSQTTPNGKGKVIINLWKVNAASVVRGSMMFAKKTNLNVEVGDNTYSKDCKFSVMKTDSVYLLGMTGHFHSLGKNFWVDKMQTLYDAQGNSIGDTLIQTIYRSATWSEPPFTVYDTPVKLNLAMGEFLRYNAEYDNKTGKSVPFGPHVAYEEHMNLFVWFAPGYNDGQTIYDSFN